MRGLRAPLPGWTQKEGESLLCPSCWDRAYAFDRARSFAVYEDAVVRAILLLKSEQIEPLRGLVCGAAGRIGESGGDRLAADVVVPVLLHRERERERGYNQTSLLSKPLARRHR